MNEHNAAAQCTNRDIINYALMAIDDKYAARRILEADSRWLDMTPEQLRRRKDVRAANVAEVLRECGPLTMRSMQTHKPLSTSTTDQYWDHKATKISEAENFGKIPPLNMVEHILKQAMHPRLPAKVYWMKLLSGTPQQR